MAKPKKKKMKKYKLMRIDWYDAETDSGWLNLEEVQKETMPLVHSIGLVIKQNRKEIFITHSISTSECNSYLVVPRSMVKEMTVIKIFEFEA